MTKTNQNSARFTEERVKAWAETRGITMDATFVPFSKSRNAEEKHPSLNWKIALSKNGRVFLTTDYMQGSGYAPAYKLFKHNTSDHVNAIQIECETGRECTRRTLDGFPMRNKPIDPPSIVNVLASLAMDASAIDSATYEDWACELGYDQDIRKGEAIYRQCLEIALKLRAAVGDQGLQKLREATQDW
jgi:hypothetical protein